MKYLYAAIISLSVCAGFPGCGKSEREEKLEQDIRKAEQTLEKNRESIEQLAHEVNALKAGLAEREKQEKKAFVELSEKIAGLEKMNNEISEELAHAEQARKTIREEMWTDAVDREAFTTWKEELRVPAVRVRRTEKPPVIDGKLDERYTTLAEPLYFRDITDTSGKGKPSKIPTAYLVMGPEALYLAVHVNQMTIVNRRREKRDSALWNGECIDIFIDPKAGSDWGRYYHIITNLNGALYDAISGNTGWNPSLEVACGSVSDNAWVMEMKIPLKELNADIHKIHKVWNFNITYLFPSNNDKHPMEHTPDIDLAWSPTGSSSSHVQDRFGYLWFSFAGRPGPKLLKK